MALTQGARALRLGGDVAPSVPSVEEELNQGDGGIECQASVPFQRRASGSPTVTEAELVPHLSEIEHRRRQGAQDFVRGRTALGRLGDGLPIEPEFDGNLPIQLRQAVPVCVLDTALVEDQLERRLG